MDEVAVIGGGFVGSFISWLLAEKGINVTLFEEHSQFGYPPHCTGLVSISGLERLGIYDILKRKKIILNEDIRSAIFMTHSGKKFLIKLNEPVAVVLDRPYLDRTIAEKAINSGVKVNLLTRVTNISLDGEITAVSKNTGIFKKRFKVIVDAEGAGRRLIRKFPEVNMKGLLPAFQQDVKGVSYSNLLDTSRVILYFNLPDFFSWIVPIDDSGEKWRIGLATKKHSSKLAQIAKLITRLFLKNTKILNTFGGLVVSKGPLKKFVWGKIAAIGDAAGQVKPTTGGGVIFGGFSAVILSKIIQMHLDYGLSLTYYDLIWRKFFGTNFRAMIFIRDMYNILTHSGIDIVARFVPHNVLNNFKTDFDFQLEGILRKLR